MKEDRVHLPFILYTQTCIPAKLLHSSTATTTTTPITAAVTTTTTVAMAAAIYGHYYYHAIVIQILSVRLTVLEFFLYFQGVAAPQ